MANGPKSNQSLRILFMGTPEFAVPSLAALINEGYNVVGVVTQPDRPSGRGLRINFSPVKNFALSHHLLLYQPADLRGEQFLNEMKRLQFDLGVVVAFRFLPERLRELPRWGCINVHASLLPKYRGAAPIHWAVINGEGETGITVFFLDKFLDTGDILLQRSISIGPEETTGEVYERLKELGARVLVESIRSIERGDPSRLKQEEEFVSHAPKIKKEDGRVDWNKTAFSIHNHVRGMTPWPGAFTYHQDQLLILEKVCVDQETRKKGQAGEVVQIDPAVGIDIMTGRGVIRILQVKPAGKHSMPAYEFVKGHALRIGDRLDTGRS